MKPKMIQRRTHAIKKLQNTESAPKGDAKSDAFEAIHSAAFALYDAGVIDKMTMLEFDAACLKVSDHRGDQT